MAGGEFRTGPGAPKSLSAASRIAYLAECAPNARLAQLLPEMSARLVFVRHVGTDASPSRLASGRELLAKVCERLSDDERRLVERRIAGRTWAELAAEFGVSVESLRKLHSRALDRVAREFDRDGGYDA